jgi:lysozyme
MSSNPPRLSGVDVSHFQGAVDWQAVKAAGCAFAFAKATEGAGIADPYFPANWAGMKAAGLLRGAYHFFRAEQDATEQAAHFLSTVQFEPGDLPPVLDIEGGAGVSGEGIVGGVQTWLDAVEPVAGVTPIIYTNTPFWDENFTDQFGQYPLWIAHYGPEPSPLPRGWAVWTFWQYSQSLHVSGVNGPADHDYFNGPLSQLQALAVKQ